MTFASSLEINCAEIPQAMILPEQLLVRAKREF